MKIRTQLTLTLSFFGLVLTGMAISLILTNRQVDRLRQQEEIARRIEQTADELNYLSGDYLIYGESQQRARWESSFASFSEDISKLDPANSEQQAIIANIKADQARLQAVFADVSATLEEFAPSDFVPDPAFVQVSWSRMEVQNQNMAFEASLLSQKLRDQADQLKRLNLILIFVLIGIFGAYLVTNYYLIYQRTLKSIAELQAGTAILGSGNLDFTIAVKQADEIGELSHAFNQMAADLKGVTASKTDLEREIAERQRAEENLRMTNQRLQEQAEELDVQAEELRMQAEELAAANDLLRESEERYRSLFDSMTEGFALHEIICDDAGAPCDYRFLEINHSFEQQTGLSREAAIGKTVSEVLPGTEKSWIETYGQVALTGQPAHFDSYASALDHHYEVYAYSPAPRQFAALFVDITARKRVEEAMQQLNAELEQRVAAQTAAIMMANEELEQRIAARTSEIQAANQELRAARLAAINLMEDALHAQGELERLNAMLRESEKRLSHAQEIAHLGSWELDLLTNKLTWSDEVYRIFGLQPQGFDATYEAFLEAVHPDDRAAVDEAYSASLREGSDGYEIEHRIVKRPGGEVRIVYEKCEHVRNEAGQIIRSAGMVHDITERKQAEESRREAAERFRIVADFTYNWEYWRSPENHFHYISPSSERITGFPPEAFIDDPDLLLKIVHPDDRERLAEHYHEDLLRTDAYEIEFRIIRQDGQERWIGHACRPVLDDQGRALGRRASNRDITGRKRSEEALRKAHDELELRVRERTQELEIANRELSNEINERKEIERQLRVQTTAMDAAANGIILTDPRGIIEWINPALTQMTGYSEHELIGQNMRVFRSGKHDPVYYQHMWETILAGNVWQGDTTNRRKDGSLYVEEQTITPVLDETGQISHFISIKQDVTERNLIQAQLEASNRELTALTLSERQQRRLAEGLVESSVVLNMNLELDSVLDHIFEQTRLTIPYLIADIVLIEDDHARLARQWGFEGHPEARTVHFESGDLPIHQFPMWENIRATQSTELIPDTTLEKRWDPYFGMTWIRSYLGAPLIYKDEVIGIINLGSDQAYAFRDEMADHLRAFAASAAIAVQNARLYEAEQQNRKVAEILSKASVALTQSLDIRQVMETILDYVQLVLPFDIGFIVLSEGEERYGIRGVRTSNEQSLAGSILNQSFDLLSEPVLKPFFENRTSTFIRDAHGLEAWAPPAELASMRSWLGIPLLSTGKVMGMVVATNSVPDSFSEDQIRLAEAVVSQATVALQNAWLFEQVRSGRERLQLLSRHLVEIQESERKYIARELHDETSQALTSLKLGLYTIEQESENQGIIVGQVANLKKLADEILESLHRLAINLRPASLDHLGLVEALTSLVQSTGQRAGIAARFKCLGVDQRNRLTEDVEASLYRIVQESLTNIVRHAHAANADVILEWKEDKIVIIVEDDGVGLDLPVARSNGQLGLVGMQERAEMLGGTLLIDSTPHAGTTLVVEIPYVN